MLEDGAGGAFFGGGIFSLADLNSFLSPPLWETTGSRKNTTSSKVYGNVVL